MRVLFLTLYPESAASPRYRVAQFLPYLHAQGVACTVASAVSEDTFQRRQSRRAFWYHLDELHRRWSQTTAASQFDVVVLQKALTSIYLRGMVGRFRASAPNFLYDIDDAVHLATPNPVPSRWAWLAQPDQPLELMRRARCVLAGNPWLADVARATGGHAEVFPTVVDTDRFRPTTARSTTYRVGWIGSPSTAYSLRIAAPALDALGDAEVHLMGAGENHGLRQARTHPWTLDSEIDFLQNLSVGLMPLPKDEWTRGKCALKALQYMACGIPCVATPYGAVTDIIRHGENGLFAESPREWSDALEQIRDPDVRRRLGEAARATVEARYSLRYAAPHMMTLLQQAAWKE